MRGSSMHSTILRIIHAQENTRKQLPFISFVCFYTAHRAHIKIMPLIMQIEQEKERKKKNDTLAYIVNLT